MLNNPHQLTAALFPQRHREGDTFFVFQTGPDRRRYLVYEAKPILTARHERIFAAVVGAIHLNARHYVDVDS